MRKRETRYRPSARAIGAVGLLAAALLLPLAGPPAAAAAAEGDIDEAPRARVRESVTVTETRLRDRPAELLRAPAHVTVLSRPAIAESGAGTLQELLAAEAGAILFDRVGNDVGKTFDLRGFSGTGTKV